MKTPYKEKTIRSNSKAPWWDEHTISTCKEVIFRIVERQDAAASVGHHPDRPDKGRLCPDFAVRHGGREENQIEEAGQNRGCATLQIRPQHHPTRRPFAGHA